MKQPHSQERSTHVVPHLLLDTTTVTWCVYVCSSVKWACSCDHSPVTSRTATTGALSYPLSHSRLPPQPRPLISTVLPFKMSCGWNPFVASWNGLFSLGMIPLPGCCMSQRLLFAANSCFRAWGCHGQLNLPPVDGHLDCLQPLQLKGKLLWTFP